MFINNMSSKMIIIILTWREDAERARSLARPVLCTIFPALVSSQLRHSREGALARVGVVVSILALKKTN